MIDWVGGYGSRNLPYGVDDAGHVVVAYHQNVIDLSRLTQLDVGPECWTSGSLNAFMELGPDAWRRTRMQIQKFLADLPGSALRPMNEVQLVLPWKVADYVDFYACEEHAASMGRLLRRDADPLPPAWKYLPIGYHGRSGTVLVSGDPIGRPSGIRATGSGPAYGPSERLDVEVELGFVVGVGNRRGCPISTAEANHHVFGAVLVNDWSARDIQSFEYQPLGPFLGKSFATSVSPWVVPLGALSDYWVQGPCQQPEPEPHLREKEPRALDLHLQLRLNDSLVSEMNARGLYWSMAQQLAHLTSNGASVRTGDLFASGTISGSRPQSAGSLMELTSAGRNPITLDSGDGRTWLQDGDGVEIRGWCGDRTGNEWISFGTVLGMIDGVRGR